MYTIRRGNHGDVAKIREIMETVHGLLDNKAWYYIDGTTSIWLHNHVEEEGFTLVVENDKNNEVIAFLVVRYPRSAPDNLGEYISDIFTDVDSVAHMETVAVLPEHRGNQLQVKLIEQAEMMLDGGIKYSMCTVHPENYASVGSFAKCHYKIIYEEENKYKDLPRVVMMKEIIR